MRHLLTVSVILKKWQQRLPRNKATGTDLWICFKKAQAEISGSNHYKWSAVVHDAATSEPSLENRYFIFHWTKWWCILKARLNTSESRLLSEGILIAKFRTSSKTLNSQEKKSKRPSLKSGPFKRIDWEHQQLLTMPGNDGQHSQRYTQSAFCRGQGMKAVGFSLYSDKREHLKVLLNW